MATITLFPPAPHTQTNSYYQFWPLDVNARVDPPIVINDPIIVGIYGDTAIAGDPNAMLVCSDPILDCPRDAYRGYDWPSFATEVRGRISLTDHAWLSTCAARIVLVRMSNWSVHCCRRSSRGGPKCSLRHCMKRSFRSALGKYRGRQPRAGDDS